MPPRLRGHGRAAVGGARLAGNRVRLSDPAFYLSGPPAMQTALTDQLRERGVAGDAIRTDAWE